MRLILAALFCLLSLAAQAQFLGGPQLTLINTGRPPESVFDNNGAPWPFLNLVPAIAYDKGGQNLAYNVTARSDPGCTQNGSTYRGGTDYVNFKTSTWAAQPTIPFQLCGSTTLPTGGEYHNYAIAVTQAGPFTITLYTANPNPGATWKIYIDGITGTPAATMALNGNGNPGDFSTVVSTTSAPFNMSQGNHTLSIVATAGDPTGNYIGDFNGWQGSVAGNTVACAFGNSTSLTGVPSQVTSVGINTCVLDFNFAGGDTFANTPSNWLDCAGATHPVLWVWPWFQNTGWSCSNVNITTDTFPGGDGSTVLHMSAPANGILNNGQVCNSGGGSNPIICNLNLTSIPLCGSTFPSGWPTCVNNFAGPPVVTPSQGWYTPFEYYSEITFRVTPASLESNPNSRPIDVMAFFASSMGCNGAGNCGWLDQDNIELNDQPSPTSYDSFMQGFIWCGPGFNGGLCMSTGVSGTFGANPTGYLTYATRITNDGTNVASCSWLNGVPVVVPGGQSAHCFDVNATGSILPSYILNQHWAFNYTSIGQNGSQTATHDLLIKRIRWFTCPGGLGQNGSANLPCSNGLAEF